MDVIHRPMPATAPTQSPQPPTGVCLTPADTPTGVADAVVAVAANSAPATVSTPAHREILLLISDPSELTAIVVPAAGT